MPACGHRLIGRCWRARKQLPSRWRASSGFGIQGIPPARVAALGFEHALQIQRIVQALVGRAGPEAWRRQQRFKAIVAVIRLPPPHPTLTATEQQAQTNSQNQQADKHPARLPGASASRARASCRERAGGTLSQDQPGFEGVSRFSRWCGQTISGVGCPPVDRAETCLGHPAIAMPCLARASMGGSALTGSIRAKAGLRKHNLLAVNLRTKLPGVRKRRTRLQHTLSKARSSDTKSQQALRQQVDPQQQRHQPSEHRTIPDHCIDGMDVGTAI